MEDRAHADVGRSRSAGAATIARAGGGGNLFRLPMKLERHWFRRRAVRGFWRLDGNRSGGQAIVRWSQVMRHPHRNGRDNLAWIQQGVWIEDLLQLAEDIHQ